MPRTRVVAVPAVLAVLAVVGAWTVVAGGPGAAYYSVRHRGDEAAFRSYVAQYVGYAFSHPDEVLAEGKDACRWLRSQPRAPRVRTDTGPYSFADVAGRYERFSTRLDPYVSPEGRSTVVAGAWTHLCPAELRLHVARAPED